MLKSLDFYGVNFGRYALCENMAYVSNKQTKNMKASTIFGGFWGQN